MVWLKMHDGADLDADVQALRADPFDIAGKVIKVPDDYVGALEARMVWFSMLLYASRESTDGLITPTVLPMIAANAQIRPDRLMPSIDKLCAVGLLHRRAKRLGGGFGLRNFLKYNPSREQIQRANEKTSNHDWLHKSDLGRALKRRIIDRDGNWCRYCGTELSAPGDRRSPQRRTFDFVDPDLVIDKRTTASAEALDAAFAGIVLACGYCNATKNARTPEDAGMALRPPAGPGSGSIRVSTRDTSSRVDDEPGSGRNGSRGGTGAPIDSDEPSPEGAQ